MKFELIVHFGYNMGATSNVAKPGKMGD